MLNYNKSSIYKLCCKDLEVEEIYVGSTTNFKRRRSSHKSHSDGNNSNQSEYKVYQFMRANGGWGNWTMVLLEKYNCDNKIELHTRERYWIEELKSELNSQIPCRTKKEYNSDNKEKISVRKKEWCSDNSEHIKIQGKEYYQREKILIAEKSKVYYQKNKSKVLERVNKYRKVNFDNIAVKNKKYYEKNRKEILLKAEKKRFRCGCGGNYIAKSKSNIKRHEDTKQHKEWIDSIIYIIIED
jgi:hypothetical protein